MARKLFTCPLARTVILPHCGIMARKLFTCPLARTVIAGLDPAIFYPSFS